VADSELTMYPKWLEFPDEGHALSGWTASHAGGSDGSNVTNVANVTGALPHWADVAGLEHRIFWSWGNEWGNNPTFSPSYGAKVRQPPAPPFPSL
jgi:hypothetical protein